MRTGFRLGGGGSMYGRVFGIVQLLAQIRRAAKSHGWNRVGFMAPPLPRRARLCRLRSLSLGHEASCEKVERYATSRPGCPVEMPQYSCGRAPVKRTARRFPHWEIVGSEENAHGPWCASREAVALAVAAILVPPG